VAVNAIAQSLLCLIFKLMPRKDKCTNMLGVYAKK